MAYSDTVRRQVNRSSRQVYHANKKVQVVVDRRFHWKYHKVCCTDTLSIASLCNLKASLMNVQWSLIWICMHCKFHLGHITAETIKNICCANEDAVDQNTVTKWLRKFYPARKNLNDLAKSGWIMKPFCKSKRQIRWVAQRKYEVSPNPMWVVTFTISTKSFRAANYQNVTKDFDIVLMLSFLSTTIIDFCETQYLKINALLGSSSSSSSSSSRHTNSMDSFESLSQPVLIGHQIWKIFSMVSSVHSEIMNISICVSQTLVYLSVGIPWRTSLTRIIK